MSSTFSARSREFFIPRDREDEAKAALQKLLEENDPRDERVFRTLTSAAAAFDWRLEPAEPREKVQGYTRIAFLGEYRAVGDNPGYAPEFLAVLAPFIRKGSYVECTENGQTFRLYFNGDDKIFRADPVTTWPVPAEFLPAGGSK